MNYHMFQDILNNRGPGPQGGARRAASGGPDPYSRAPRTYGAGGPWERWQSGLMQLS